MCVIVWREIYFHCSTERVGSLSPAVAPPAAHSWQAQRGLDAECCTISCLSLRLCSSLTSHAVGTWKEADGRLLV